MTPPGDSCYQLTRRVIVSMRNHQPERGQSLEPMPSRLRPFRSFRLPDNNQIIVSSTNHTAQVIKQPTVGQGTFVCVLGDAPHVPR